MLKPKLAPIALALLTIPILSLLSEHIIDSYRSLAYSSPEDAQTYISNRVSEQSDITAIYNVGASALKRALNEDYVLKIKFENNYEFYNLVYPGQTIAESLMLLKTANVKKGDLVILHTSIRRINTLYPVNSANFCNPYIHSYYYKNMLATFEQLGLSNAGTSNLCKLTLITKRKVISHILINMIRILAGGKNITYTGSRPYQFETSLSALNDERELILKFQRMEIGFYERWLELNDNHAKKSIEIIKKIGEHLKSVGAKLVIIDPPQNIEWFRKNFPYMDELYEPRYLELFAQLKSMGIGYYDLRKHGGFSYEDFYDHEHMLQSGRDKFFPVYKNIISKELESPLQQ